MARDPGHQSTGSSCGPVVHMAFEEVSVVEKERSLLRLSVLSGPKPCDNQRGNHHSQRRGGVPPGLFPAILLRRGTMPHKVGRPLANHRPGIEGLQTIFLEEAPCQNDGVGHSVKLNSCPIGSPVDPEILVESSIGKLAGSKIDQSPIRALRIAEGQKARGAVAEVTGPDQMISAESGPIIVNLSPGNALRGNDRARI